LTNQKLFEYIEKLYGESSAKEFESFMGLERSTYIRVNPLKIKPNKLQNRLKEKYGIDCTTVPNFPNALKVTKNANVVGKTLEHIIGLYYIQNLSSMVPALILNPAENDFVLDLCAAPGSKTTLLAEIMKNKGTLIANEISLNRVKMLVYNLDRMNIINAGTLHNRGEWLSKIYQNYFDKILIDAPCSGLGIIQKKEEVLNWWSKDRAERLGELQTKLLVAGLKMLKVGGELVYSTCTLTVEENELIINKILRKYPVEVMEFELPMKSIDGFTFYEDEKLNSQLSKAKRILPWETDSEGFFIIKLKKTSEIEPPSKTSLSPSKIRLLKDTHPHVKEHINYLSEEFGIDRDIFSNFKFLAKKNNIYFVDKQWEDENPDSFERIGTKLGTIDNTNRIVFHTQAAQVLQNHIKRRVYKIQDDEELKKYMEGGTFKKDLDQLGQYAIKFEAQILGTAIAVKDGIKSRFPRAKRTQEIYLEY